MDDEILQDFLVEAQEILENLDSQLIGLESAPNDKALLNAIFRGFHTIKGGAGFLSLDALVEVAHKAEDVFDLLRNGKRALDAATMDVFLQVLDTLRGMFDALHAGRIPDHAEPALTAALRSLAAGETLADAALAPAIADTGGGEFDDVVAGMMAGEAADPSPAGELISDDEFEDLLDRLQGEGRGPVVAAAATESKSELISDDEFDSLLDELHGAGRFDASAVVPSAAAVVVAPVSPPAAPAPTKPATPKAADARAQDGGDAQAKDNTIRVGTDVLDRIMNMVGELVLIRNRLSNLQASVGNAEVTQAVASLDVVTSDLQMAAMKTRMQPIKKVFGRFPRVVRDLARSLKKEIELEMSGEDTDLDKTLVEALADPLVHLVRNAVDHGIEDNAEARRAAGKSEVGRIELHAFHKGGSIIIEIKDDGKGLDKQRILQKAYERGLLREGEVPPDRDIYNLIFEPGFSTAKTVTDISGRGVGMDVVRRNVEELRGTCEIQSEPGKGSVFSIKLPLTLAIIEGMVVSCGSEHYIIPTLSVVRLVRPQADDISQVFDRGEMIAFADEHLSLVRLHRLFNLPDARTEPTDAVVVVVEDEGRRLGVLADDLLGQQSIVIKSLGESMQDTPGVAGAAIMANGNVALILDVAGLNRLARNSNLTAS
jgi:two-component system chemotaxis sensor kinase CheA